MEGLGVPERPHADARAIAARVFDMEYWREFEERRRVEQMLSCLHTLPADSPVVEQIALQDAERRTALLRRLQGR